MADDADDTRNIGIHDPALTGEVELSDNPTPGPLANFLPITRVRYSYPPGPLSEATVSHGPTQEACWYIERNADASVRGRSQVRVYFGPDSVTELPANSRKLRELHFGELARGAIEPRPSQKKLPADSTYGRTSV
jgi:hypothetical protein